jgi:hypothetical protein
MEIQIKTDDFQIQVKGNPSNKLIAFLKREFKDKVVFKAKESKKKTKTKFKNKTFFS